jgi:hypothetical protein
MIPREILKKIRQIELRANRIVTGGFFARLSKSLLEFGWITRGMENRNHCKYIILDREINGVFPELAKANLPRASANSLKMPRIGQRPLQREFYFQFKFSSKSGVLCFVPGDRLFKLQTCRGFEDDGEVHYQPKRLLRSASTCSQGIPSRGFFSNSARRRSNSATCSGVKSGSNPSPMRSSLSFCASSIRSAKGRVLAALNNSVAVMQLNLSTTKGFASA